MSFSPLTRPAHWLLALAILLIFGSSFLKSENAAYRAEVELTPELLSQVTPKLSNPTSAAQLEIVDRLVFGKGNILKSRGKESEVSFAGSRLHGKAIRQALRFVGLRPERQRIKGLDLFQWCPF